MPSYEPVKLFLSWQGPGDAKLLDLLSRMFWRDREIESMPSCWNVHSGGPHSPQCGISVHDLMLS